MTAEAPTKTATLAERILAITAEMPPIKATGKSPFSKEPALSIEDVEDAVRPLLVKHGVLIRFKTRNLIRAEKEWVAEVTACVGDTQYESHGETYSGEPGFQDDWADCGSTPAAAYSFARKSYLKQLFHIAGEDDSQQPHGGNQSAVAPRAAAGAKECPFCAEMGYLNTRGGVSVYFQPTKGPNAGNMQCNGRIPEEDKPQAEWAWCNHPLPDFDFEKP